ncbi:MAG: hypothetical protein BGO96_01575 [Micrococcales bacterium 73-15]|uniref:VOC family protein n=1 Tax=Salana multivorans TaxID=120377 RepID=UPI00095C9C6C|nr:VOC family protein [Salana multivorans]OJX94777.1 MAG: hypothetical protein BGO96_01575 [Micrococcales bacterium 73-15]
MSDAPVTWPRSITAVTLGVEDVGRSLAFYRALGWAADEVHDEVAFVHLAGQVLCLFARAGLAADTGRDDLVPGSGSVALARNVETADDVDRAYAAALAAGALGATPPRPTDWGGRSCYVADPDGHLWELAWNPFWLIGPDGVFAGDAPAADPAP